MTRFVTHSLKSAPEGSRKTLEALQAQVGFIPSLAAAMAESPELLRGFVAVRDIYQGGSFTPAEIQVLSLTAAFENGCAWCMAFHSLMALKSGVPEADVQALREGRTPATPRLGALSDFARTTLRERGAARAADLERLAAAGFSKAQALEVVLGMAFSLMANYAGNLVDAPLDPPLAPHAWKRR